MVNLTVYLTPELTGALGKLVYIYGDTVYPIINLPASVDGVITSGVAVSSPELDFAVLFLEQTVGGVKYAEVMSSLFNLLSDVNVNVTLEPLTAPGLIPTTLALDVFPTSGTPPYEVTLTATLTYNNNQPISGRVVTFYKNDSFLAYGQTMLPEGKTQEITDTVTEETSYYAYFAGDSMFEGCEIGDGAAIPGIGGVGILILAYLILKGGK